MPRVRKNKEMETSNHQIGQDKTIVVPATGSIDRDEIVPGFEAVDGPKAMDKANELAFMEEMVEVVVAATTDKNAERFPHVAVNGVNQYFVRNEKMKVRRKFIEALARAKKTAVSTVAGKDQDGADTMNIAQSTGLRYPFSVVHDPNPRGHAWLEKVLAEG